MNLTVYLQLHKTGWGFVELAHDHTVLNFKDFKEYESMKTLLGESSCRRVSAGLLTALLSELFPLFLFLISFAKWPKRHANT